MFRKRRLLNFIKHWKYEWTAGLHFLAKGNGTKLKQKETSNGDWHGSLRININLKDSMKKEKERTVTNAKNIIDEKYVTITPLIRPPVNQN